MSNLVDITLLSPHRVLGKLQAEDAQCSIHKEVAENLIERGIAKLANESSQNKTDGERGE